jgi:HlyD family secretion protein
MKRPLLLGIPLLAVLAGCAAWAALKPKPPAQWKFVKVERGDVNRKVTATGTINALTQVSVGTQVSGVVTGLYADFNSIVKKGQVVARIDSTVNETQVADAQAGLRKAQAACDRAKSELERNRRLAEQKLLAEADLEGKATAYQTALGDLEAARAALARARINLGYCTITAPVDGVVVSRVVDVGQTVAASFSTPSLFSIAKDLSRMKVQAAIDEADIGQIQAGQEAAFTVDSYPGMAFKGTVSEVQLNPTVASNVVTYCVVMEVENVPRPAAKAVPFKASGTARYIPEGSPVYRGEMALFPGMTANVSILTADRKAVLRVPNMALRFNPGVPGAPKGDKVWVLENNVPKALPVTIVTAGSQFSEVTGEGLREGLVLVAGTENGAAAPVAARSPLATGPGGPPPR